MLARCPRRSARTRRPSRTPPRGSVIRLTPPGRRAAPSLSRRARVSPLGFWRIRAGGRAGVARGTPPPKTTSTTCREGAVLVVAHRSTRAGQRPRRWDHRPPRPRSSSVTWRPIRARSVGRRAARRGSALLHRSRHRRRWRRRCPGVDRSHRPRPGPPVRTCSSSGSGSAVSPSWSRLTGRTSGLGLHVALTP